MSVVPKLAGSVHSFLNVGILAAKLFNLLLYGILHEVLAGAVWALVHHGALAADWVQFLICEKDNEIKLKNLILTLSLELVSELTTLRSSKLWWTMRSNASLDLS